MKFDKFHKQEFLSLKSHAEGNTVKIDDLYVQSADLREKIETIGALDLHKMLSLPQLPTETVIRSPKSKKKQSKKNANKNLTTESENFDIEKSRIGESIENSDFNEADKQNLGQNDDNKQNDNAQQELTFQSKADETQKLNDNIDDESDDEVEVPSEDEDNPEDYEPKIYNMKTLKHIIRRTIDHHIISYEMDRSKENDIKFRKRMKRIEISIKDLESRHLDRFDKVDKVAFIHQMFLYYRSQIRFMIL